MGDGHTEDKKHSTGNGKKKRVLPPIEHRFVKGKSGNPRGRPKSKAPTRRSAYEVLLEDINAVSSDGTIHTLSSEEALALKTYQAAMAGKTSAIRRVFKMIRAREEWYAAREAKRRGTVKLTYEATDPDNANEALLLLQIAQIGAPHSGDRARLRSPQTGKAPRECFKLATWAVNAALRRPGRRLSQKDAANIEHGSANPEDISWPKSVKNSEDE